MWRTTPMSRREMPVGEGERGAPQLPEEVEPSGIQPPEAGVGPSFHRRYRVSIADADISGRELMACIQADLNVVAPTEFARFHKTFGAEGRMDLGDEYLVHMPGPWNGPIRVAEVTDDSFRFATLQGHLEAGQIEFRALGGGDLVFEIESWARSGDILSTLMYDRLRMAKEVQLHMWTSTLERIVKLSGGSRRGRISIESHRSDVDG
jgi:hypothetical protein